MVAEVEGGTEMGILSWLGVKGYSHRLECTGSEPEPAYPDRCDLVERVEEYASAGSYDRLSPADCEQSRLLPV